MLLLDSTWLHMSQAYLQIHGRWNCPLHAGRAQRLRVQQEEVP